MVTDVYYSKDFENDFKKADNTIKKRIIKQIEKIIKNPKVGKTMMYSRTGTREVYIKPFRLSYKYNLKKDEIVILKLYHKDDVVRLIVDVGIYLYYICNKNTLLIF